MHVGIHENALREVATTELIISGNLKFHVMYSSFGVQHDRYEHVRNKNIHRANGESCINDTIVLLFRK